ncbi:hypothetical protein Afil01_47460 [Actinorhabdospora filicis]|uniref:Uncharacterized protein n=1 Tax=Actinorhabdospora filicis TaxID=1785913 RepID=A0A9W6WAS1_9ACTN|nr:hypothetical protein Afil01_47460 [Actinorhabdospora filicis]
MRPPLTAKSRPLKTGEPSGQAKEMAAAVMVVMSVVLRVSREVVGGRVCETRLTGPWGARGHEKTRRLHRDRAHGEDGYVDSLAVVTAGAVSRDLRCSMEA